MQTTPCYKVANAVFRHAPTSWDRYRFGKKFEYYVVELTSYPYCLATMQMLCPGFELDFWIGTVFTRYLRGSSLVIRLLSYWFYAFISRCWVNPLSHNNPIPNISQELSENHCSSDYQLCCWWMINCKRKDRTLTIGTYIFGSTYIAASSATLPFFPDRNP